MAELLGIKGLGGMDEIGASSTLVFTTDDLGNSRNIVIDSGMRVRNERLEGGKLVSRSEGHLIPQETIHAVLVTHAHLDHVGNMPFLVDANPQAAVFMTLPTLHIAGETYMDTIRIMREGRSSFSSVDWDSISKFSRGAKIIIMDNQDNTIKKPGWVNLFPGIDAYFGPNGHIRGSAFIVLKVGSRMIMFSGDISVFDSPTVRGMKVPEEFIGRLDAIFIEATYGHREFERSRAEEEDRMARLANETIANGGSCLFPAFGIGRSPDVFLALLIRGVNPLYLDGMGRKILDIYTDRVGYWSELDHSSGVNLESDPRIQLIKDRAERDYIIYGSEKFNVVTTAGMMIEGSCAWQYAQGNGFLENPFNLLGQTGYQAEYTEGKALEEVIDGGKEVSFGGRKLTVQARVVRLGLSSHASGMQLADIVNRLKPAKTFINHGTEEGRTGLENNLGLLGYTGEIHKPKNMDMITI